MRLMTKPVTLEKSTSPQENDVVLLMMEWCGSCADRGGLLSLSATPYQGSVVMAMGELRDGLCC